MTFASNPGFLAVAFMEGSAAFILLVLYCLLIPGFPARFFRYWLAGWSVYVGLEGLRIYSLWADGGSNDPRFVPELSLAGGGAVFCSGARMSWAGQIAEIPVAFGRIVARSVLAWARFPRYAASSAQTLNRCLECLLLPHFRLALLAIAGAAPRRGMESPGRRPSLRAAFTVSIASDCAAHSVGSVPRFV